jgi:Sulfotransferase family
MNGDEFTDRVFSPERVVQPESCPIPVLILGSGRSGTTITASLLSRLSRIHIAKETGYIGLCLPLLERIDQPEALQQLVDTVNSWLDRERWEHRASSSGYHEFCRRYGLSGGGAFLHYVWQLDSPVPWHELSHIGDNTPLYVMAIPAIQRLLPNAKFIHMIRDPRDVVCSIVKMRFGAKDLVAAAMEWHLYAGCWLMAERTLPISQRLECRYEDLCTSPESTLTRLAEFLNCTSTDAVEALRAHAAAGAAGATGFGNVAGMSHHQRLNEALNPGRIGRYRKELTERQICQLEAILQYGLTAFGYPLTSWQVSPLMQENRMAYLSAQVRDLVKRVLFRLTKKGR